MSDDTKSSKLPWLLWVVTLAAAIAAGYFALQKLEAVQNAQAEAVTATELASKKAADCQKDLEGATAKLDVVASGETTVPFGNEKRALL